MRPAAKAEVARGQDGKLNHRGDERGVEEEIATVTTGDAKPPERVQARQHHDKNPPALPPWRLAQVPEQVSRSEQGGKAKRSADARVVRDELRRAGPGAGMHQNRPTDHGGYDGDQPAHS